MNIAIMYVYDNLSMTIGALEQYVLLCRYNIVHALKFLYICTLHTCKTYMCYDDTNSHIYDDTNICI
jgi:hypothetical protein